jgi:hypothetical protein
MKIWTWGLTALLLSGSLTGFGAPKTKPKPHVAKKPAVEVKYKAKCGMIYTAAEAKKNRYICPMDKKPLTKMISKVPNRKKS